jgi:hypothetical protein
MLPTRRELPVTQIVDAVMEGNTSASCVEDYITFDPKTTKQEAITFQRPQTFTDAIVFVIGGGNYYEYHNLREYCQVSI